MKPQPTGNGVGGARPNSGRKAESFRKRCADLAQSPKFFAFAKEVFDGKEVEPRLTKDGEIVYLQASVGDRVYLWEKLAQYGFGKPVEFVMPPVAPRSVEESKRYAEQTHKLLKELEADTAHAHA